MYLCPLEIQIAPLPTILPPYSSTYYSIYSRIFYKLYPINVTPVILYLVPLSPLLNTGQIVPLFRSFGIPPLLQILLINSKNTSPISFGINLHTSFSMPFSSGAFPFFKSISCANSSSLVILSSPPSDVYSSSLLSSISSISSSITLSDVPSSKSLKCRLQLPNCMLSSILSFFFLYLLICFHASSSVLIDFILSSSSFSYLCLSILLHSLYSLLLLTYSSLLILPLLSFLSSLLNFLFFIFYSVLCQFLLPSFHGILFLLFMIGSFTFSIISLHMSSVFICAQYQPSHFS